MATQKYAKKAMKRLEKERLMVRDIRQQNAERRIRIATKPPRRGYGCLLTFAITATIWAIAYYVFIN